MPADAIAIVQARMSSRRFPGKVLAPLAGRPLLEHVLSRAVEVVGPDRVILATSDHPTDAPLVRFAASLGHRTYAGPLDDVVSRFQGALAALPAEWFFRVCADSPLLDTGLMRRVLARAAPNVDVITNVHPRSFPPGRSVELVRAGPFLHIDPSTLTDDEREHVTLHMYRNASRFRIVNITATPEEAAFPSVAVDTIEDLQRVEKLLASGGAR